MSKKIIYLDDAIGALEKYTHLDWKHLKCLHPMLNVIEEMPSAQPDLQQTCNKLATDCISRHAVSAWLDNIGYPKFADVVMDENSFPSAQPEDRCGECDAWNQYKNYPRKSQWIPCSERLPEEKEKSYWVCLETGGQCQCRWTNDMYGLGANKWSEWGWHIMDKPQYSKIVAWMPLPEPYKERMEE